MTNAQLFYDLYVEALVASPDEETRGNAEGAPHWTGVPQGVRDALQTAIEAVLEANKNGG